MNIFKSKLLLIFFINFISHPSNCLYEIYSQLFTQIFNMSINYSFITVKIIFP